MSDINNSLEKICNGQCAVCMVVWVEITVTSESKTVDLRCKYNYVYVTQVSSQKIQWQLDVQWFASRVSLLHYMDKHTIHYELYKHII